MKRFGVTLMMCGLLSWQALHAPRADAQAAGVFGCPGDCNYDGRVQFNELMLGVRRGLGQPGSSSSCIPAERHCDGAVSIDDLVDAVAAGGNACTGYPTTPDSLPLGIYDTHTVGVEEGGSFTHDTLAAVDARFAPFELRLRLTPLESLYAYGSFDAEGRVCTEGSFIQGDVFSPLRGLLEYDAETERVAGSVVAQRLLLRDEIHIDIVAESGTTAPSVHEGTYDIDVEYQGEAAGVRTRLQLPVRDIDAFGVGTCGPGVETDATGLPFSEIAAGRCWVSPRGRIDFFSSEYRPAVTGGCVAPLRLIGRLGGGGEASSGSFFVGLVPPACSLGASWSVGAP